MREFKGRKMGMKMRDGAHLSRAQAAQNHLFVFSVLGPNNIKIS
jgi:hypothetical protein